jgi:hypothetical protein
MNKFSFVGRMGRDGTKEAVRRGVETALECDAGTLGFISERGDFEVVVENFSAPGMNYAGCSAELLVGGRGDVFLGEINEASVFLKKA